MSDDLNFNFDRTKTQIMMGKGSAFFGTILGSLDFSWSDKLPTAAVSSSGKFFWNPDWFLSLVNDTRKSVMMHELYHVANLHFMRQNNRDPKIWNAACDYEINNRLKEDGYTFEGTSPLIDSKYTGMSAEEIYSDLVKQKEENPDSSLPHELQGTWGVAGEGDDMVDDGDGSSEAQAISNQTMVGIVTKAIQVAKATEPSNTCGMGTSFYNKHLETFLKPKLAWTKILRKFFTQRSERQFTWGRPNRRYQDIYLPSYKDGDDSLEHVVFYLDTSGSMSENEVIRFNSEVKFIKDNYNPQLLTLVQFDTSITRERTYRSTEQIRSIKVNGWGGTDLDCVHDHIMKHKPTVAVVLSDMCCAPMESVGLIPVIWVVINNKHVEIPFGQAIHVEE